VVVRLDETGAPTGLLSLPPLTSGDESFRPIAVDGDGTILVMTGDDSGLTVTRYRFP
jgi:hypothetical protein